MREQAEIAIATADVILFVTDVQQGVIDADYKVADLLRRSGKPIVLAVNKVDSFKKYEAFRLLCSDGCGLGCFRILCPFAGHNGELHPGKPAG